MVPVGPKEGESFYRSTDQAAPTGAGHRQGAVLVQRRHHERQGRDRILDRRYGAGDLTGRRREARHRRRWPRERSQPLRRDRPVVPDQRAAPARQVFTTFSDPALPVNNLTGPGRDPETHTPEYKVTAVSVECAEHDSGSNGCPGRVEGPYGGLTVSPYVSDRRHPRLVRIKEES